MDAPDLNQFFLEYRECCRHVWNAYFQPMEDGWHEFINVENALFVGLVLSRLGISGQIERRPDGIVEAIQIVPQIPPIGYLSVYVERRGSSNHRIALGRGWHGWAERTGEP